MKLTPILALTLTALASCLTAGNQSWSTYGSYSGGTGTGTDYFNTTASTEFVASISGYGPLGGTARAFSGNDMYAYVNGIYYGTVNASNSGIAPSGKTVVIYRSIGGYEPGTYGTAKVTANW